MVRINLTIKLLKSNGEIAMDQNLQNFLFLFHTHYYLTQNKK